MALKVSKKRIKFTDESVNSKGFWTLTAGIDMSLYNSNPILLWNHDRDTRLPIGIMTDIKLNADGTIDGLPAFDENDPFAMTICSKYEDGIVNMCSAGLSPEEVNTTTEFLKGKKKDAICLSRSMLMEMSLTDIGSNRGALKVKLYDKAGAPLALQSSNELLKLFITSDNKENMLIKLSDFASQLKLAEGATEEQVLAALKLQSTENIKLKADLLTSENALKAMQTSANEAKVVSLVDKAIAEKKILPVQKETYVKLATANFDDVKNLLDSTPAHTTVATTLSVAGAEHAVEIGELIKLSGQELFLSSKMPRLKELSLAHYKIKHKEYFGVDYVEEAVK
jgi:predicted lactoylglutathione lyase